MMKPLIDIRNLHISFYSSQVHVEALRNVSFSIGCGETVALVGESGSGKSVTAAAILGLIRPPGIIEKGEIWFQGRDLLKMTPKEKEIIRGKFIGIIFQDPMSFLNPTLTIGEQISEGIRKHQKLNRKVAREETLELLQLVGIPQPERRIKQYPHELSGGMRQRVMIAIALACKPQLIIADEPTTALDVTVQAQILELLKEIQTKLGTSLLMITHDLSLVANTCRRVLVMYAGEIIEIATVEELYASPKHPYTQGLLESIPRLDFERKKSLTPIPGNPPSAQQNKPCCPFHPRCPFAMRICAMQAPPFHEISTSHQLKCWLYKKENRT